MATTDDQDPGLRPSHRMGPGTAQASRTSSPSAEDPLEAAATVAIDVSTLASLRNRPPIVPAGDPERTTTFRPVTLRTAQERPPCPSPLERRTADAPLERTAMLGASISGHEPGSRTMAVPRDDGTPPPAEFASTTTFDARSIRQRPPSPSPQVAPMLGREPVRVSPPPAQVMAMPRPPAAPMMPLPAAPPPVAPYASVSMPSASTVSRRSMGVLVVVLLLACVALGAGGGIWLAG